MRALLVPVFLLGAIAGVFAAAPALPTYVEYLAAHADDTDVAAEVTVAGAAFTRDSVGASIATGVGGEAGPVAVTGETGSIAWAVDVPATGLYSIELAYYPLPGRGAMIERALLLDGSQPFEDAGYIALPRVWADAGPVRRDLDGNEIRSRQVERPRWQAVALGDSRGYESLPLRFHLERGRNRITLVSLAEPLAIRSLRLFRYRLPPSAAEVLAEARRRGIAEASGVRITLEERDLSAKSEQTLYPVFDQGDPAAVPYDPALIRLNAVGGTLWSNPGQWIAWEFEVPADGLYQVGITAKQSQLQTLFVSRRLLVDGAPPVAEAAALRFPYSASYRMYPLRAQDGTTALVPLAKGRHELRLEAVLGELTDVLRDAEEVVVDLNTIYRRIIIVTSPVPDPLRTYQLAVRIPGVIEDVLVQRDRILDIAGRLESRTGQKGGHVALLRRIALMLERMHADPERIPGLLSEFASNVAALGSWTIDTKQAGLLVDSVTIASRDRGLPEVKAGLGRVLLHEARAFVASFTNDYSRVGSMSEPAAGTTRSIKVWLGSGRSQAQILKAMIEDSFTPETGIRVDLELVESLGQQLRDTVMGNLLIPSIIARRAPDVALGAANMDLAYRGAAADLATFPDFPEVAARFKKSALVPFRLRDAVYALPEIQVFPMLFYRRDILDELGLEIPRTWQDVERVIPELQRRNLDFGIASDMSSYLMLLYQQGISFYREDGVATNLGDEAAVQTMQRLAEFFSLYRVPVEYYAPFRFWLGEMPLVIADYSMYNMLSEHAVQLRGQWGMSPVPGTPRADGTVDRTVSVTTAIVPPGSLTPSSSTSGAMMLEQSREKAAAWEFLKWWTSADAQERFGRELESLMGSKTRYATANVEAMQRLPWRPEERRALLEQWEWTEGLPSVPGAYYVNRLFDFMRRAIVLRNEPVRETLVRYDRLINEEIARKRAEFGMPTRLEDVDPRWRASWWDQFAHLRRPGGEVP